MLEEKDLQSIGELLDKKLKTQKDEIVAEIGSATSEAFSAVEAKIDGIQSDVVGLKSDVAGLKSEVVGLKKDIALRPTLNQIMSWGDKKIVELELDMDKVKYLHQKEFDKLPPPAEISRVLVERGLKRKTA